VTPDMAFECLLVSRDTSVVGVMNRLLDNLSISTSICLSASKALNRLAVGSADLVIVDWEQDSADLVRNIRRSRGWQKPTVVAVSADGPAPGADVVLRKPVTLEACAKSLKAAYSRMLYDHRRHSRYPLLSAVTATDNRGRSVDATATDIGDGGIGLRAKQDLSIGDALSFYLQLPGTSRAIYIQARVQWTREYGVVGCEFLRIPPVDLNILHDWLVSKNRVKKPALEI
jgi:CheY-like chemotaxis protein